MNIQDRFHLRDSRLSWMNKVRHDFDRIMSRLTARRLQIIQSCLHSLGNRLMHWLAEMQSTSFFVQCSFLAFNMQQNQLQKYADSSRSFPESLTFPLRVRLIAAAASEIPAKSRTGTVVWFSYIFCSYRLHTKNHLYLYAFLESSAPMKREISYDRMRGFRQIPYIAAHEKNRLSAVLLIHILNFRSASDRIVSIRWQSLPFPLRWQLHRSDARSVPDWHRIHQPELRSHSSVQRSDLPSQQRFLQKLLLPDDR